MLTDYPALERALAKMGEQSKLYKIIKAEMKRRGRWKNVTRGKEMSPGFDSRRRI